MRCIGLLSALLLGSASLSVLACEYPPLPEFPADDDTGRRAERAFKEDTLRYLNEMASYVACIRAQYAAAGDASSLRSSLLAVRNNSAVEELEAVRKVYESRVGPITELVAEVFVTAPEMEERPGGEPVSIPRGVQDPPPNPFVPALVIPANPQP